MAAIQPIEVRAYGSGEPEVVVLHGGPGAPGSVAGLARALAAENRVLEPLQRRSGSLPLTVARHVEDLAAVAPSRALLVGWSWGAMLGLSFAARHPERVRGLVLVGCGTYDEGSRGLYQEAMQERLGDEGRARFVELQNRVATAADPVERDRWLAEMGGLAERAQAFDPLPGEESIVEVDGVGHEETWTDVLRLQAEGIEPSAFASIRAPVLMLHGAEDPHPGTATRDLLRRFVPHLEYAEFPDCGHTPWRERQAREPFLQTLCAWLAARAGA